MTPEQFKAARNQLGLSLSETSIIFRVSYDAVRRWETEPDVKRARAIPGPAQTLMHWLVSGERPTVLRSRRSDWP